MPLSAITLPGRPPSPVNRNELWTGSQKPGSELPVRQVLVGHVTVDVILPAHPSLVLLTCEMQRFQWYLLCTAVCQSHGWAPATAAPCVGGSCASAAKVRGDVKVPEPESRGEWQWRRGDLRTGKPPQRSPPWWQGPCLAPLPCPVLITGNWVGVCCTACRPTASGADEGRGSGIWAFQEEEQARVKAR